MGHIGVSYRGERAVRHVARVPENVWVAFGATGFRAAFPVSVEDFWCPALY